MYCTRKSATCCYCGSKTILTLDGVRHELKCSNCGAPLSRMKALRVDHMGEAVLPKGKKAKQASQPRFETPGKKKKKRKGVAHRLFDAAEDIFDLFD
jgi:DNA-directed RNA polymerase subunit RPC12/RpoP